VSECGQLNLAHVARNKEETKKYTSAHVVWNRFNIREGSPKETRKIIEL